MRKLKTSLYITVLLSIFFGICYCEFKQATKYDKNGKTFKLCKNLAEMAESQYSVYYTDDNVICYLEFGPKNKTGHTVIPFQTVPEIEGAIQGYSLGKNHKTREPYFKCLEKNKKRTENTEDIVEIMKTCKILTGYAI